MKRFIIAIAAFSTLGLSGSVIAQRGGGGGGYHNNDCRTGPFVQYRAQKVVDSARELRQFTRTLPRPGKWLPSVRPIVWNARDLRDIIADRGWRVCQKANNQIAALEQSIRQLRRKLHREGRGRLKQVALNYVQDVADAKNRLKKALNRQGWGFNGQ